MIDPEGGREGSAEVQYDFEAEVDRALANPEGLAKWRAAIEGGHWPTIQGQLLLFGVIDRLQAEARAREPLVRAAEAYRAAYWTAKKGGRWFQLELLGVARGDEPPARTEATGGQGEAVGPQEATSGT